MILDTEPCRNPTGTRQEPDSGTGLGTDFSSLSSSDEAQPHSAAARNRRANAPRRRVLLPESATAPDDGAQPSAQPLVAEFFFRNAPTPEPQLAADVVQGESAELEPQDRARPARMIGFPEPLKSEAMH